MFSLWFDFLTVFVCYHRRLMAASGGVPSVSSPAKAGDPVFQRRMELKQ
jgi:hypothetical protein